MKKLLCVAFIGLVMGAVLGALLAQRSIQQRQHTLAVMWLSQFHLQSLEAAVQKKDCALAAQSAAKLHLLADELPLALPLANAQDATFHGYVEQYQQATLQPDGTAGACGYDMALLKKIRAACADCHRDYR